MTLAFIIQVLRKMSNGFPLAFDLHTAFVDVLLKEILRRTAGAAGGCAGTGAGAGRCAGTGRDARA